MKSASNTYQTLWPPPPILTESYFKNIYSPITASSQTLVQSRTIWGDVKKLGAWAPPPET